MNKITAEDFTNAKTIRIGIVSVLVLLSLFLLGAALNSFAELRYVGSGIPATNTISVEATGKAFAVPDVATIYFTTQFEEDTVAQAQEKTTELTNKAIAYLKEQGIAEKDIQTQAYNVYPQYDFIQTTCVPGVPCRGGEQVLRGYQVSQRISVKVRDTQQAGTILGGLGEMGVQNISGPNFEVDDIDTVRAEAREEAIAEAQAKAKMLASELNVQLVRVVGFWENAGDHGYPMFESVQGKGGDGRATPDIPAGENEITTRVNITYEIR